MRKKKVYTLPLYHAGFVVGKIKVRKLRREGDKVVLKVVSAPRSSWFKKGLEFRIRNSWFKDLVKKAKRLGL